MTDAPDARLTSSHWGIGVVETRDGRITAVRGHASDPAPSDLNRNMAGALSDASRVLRPAVRRGWLTGETRLRGRDSYVEMDWPEVLDLLAAELTRVRSTHGNAAIFAGSYGWASAGRFHHAQSQLKRFLNCIGGFTRSEGNYSYNAALVAMPHILGGPFRQHLAEATRWSVMAEHTELLVAFGGLALRNMQICDGGASRHRIPAAMAEMAQRGVRVVSLSPLRSDVEPDLQAEWLTPRPGTDCAVMLALAYELLDQGLHDTAFLERYTVGFDRFAAYLRGETDGVPKTPAWAAQISGLPAERIASLARDMAQHRTMITCAAGLQRVDWGEQVLWATVSLAAMLGQIGLPGGGYGIGYAVNAHVGAITRPFRWGHLPQGSNPVTGFLPVAMTTQMLETPGAQVRYDGQTLTLPDARLMWWAGGNPFHHHQDLNRLHRAIQSPETVVVNEIAWTAMARHADIVLPVAAATERRDFGGGRTDNTLVPMPQHVPPPGQARAEYDIYCDLAARLGVEQVFTQGRDTEAWLRHLWADTQAAAEAHGTPLPDWDSFMAGGPIELPDPAPDRVFLSEYRADPLAHPRPTPSGRIELWSETVAGFGLPDCAGHATWVPAREAASPLPFALISGQPATRLHSQHDPGALSRSAKIQDREPVLIHPDDAAAREIRDGDVVEIWNDRGRVLAGARVTDDVMPGVLFLWTGAWFDPDWEAPQARDRHGNPNVLTHDLRTSDWSQSPAAHSARVDLRRHDAPLPRVQAFDPPDFVPDPRKS